MTAAAVLVVLPLSVIPKDWERMPRPLVLMQTLWLGILAGCLLQNSPVYWPSDNRLAVPLTLLTLAALTGSHSAPRIGAVLAFCIGLLLLPAAVSGAASIEPEWLEPTAASWPWGLTLALLLPNLPVPGGKGRPVMLGAMAIVLSALVQGTISAPVASAVRDPFYQSARTLGHLEPVIAAAMTLGWYAVAVMLLQSASELCGKGKLAAVLSAGTAAAVITTGVQLSQPVLALFSAFFWVLNPFWNKIKKS